MLRAIGGTMIVPSTELAELLQGYRRFREQGWKPERERWATLRESQEPRVMVIACSDSRVDPAQIFDFEFRDLARSIVARDQARPSCLGSATQGRYHAGTGDNDTSHSP